MGLFSFLRKNKQDATADHSAYVARDDDAVAAEARSKRASNAGGAGKPRRAGRDVPDPVLPEKKRARRRLVGAIALALAVAVGLPMLLDSEPKPLSSDIEIQIPAKDKPAAASASASAGPAASTPAAAPAAERRDAGLDPSEEVVDPKPAAPVLTPKPAVAAAPSASEVKPRSEAVVKPPKEPAVEAPRSETRAELKADTKPVVKAEAKAEIKHETKPVKTADKPEEKARPDDSARALAILEGKPVAKAAEDGGGRYAVQVAALATQEKVNELQNRLTEAGLRSQAQKGTTAAGGSIIRVRVGPFGNRDEAEKARAKLQKMGLSGSLVPLS